MSVSSEIIPANAVENYGIYFNINNVLVLLLLYPRLMVLCPDSHLPVMMVPNMCCALGTYNTSSYYGYQAREEDLSWQNSSSVQRSAQ